MTFKHVAPLLWCQIMFFWISLKSSPVNGFNLHPPSSKLTTPASLSSSTTTSLNAFKFPTLSLPWDAPQKTKSATVGERNGLDPEYPWRFEGRFIFRPSLVRTDSGLDGNGGPPSATLLSLFGYSLGGSVILEYDISPVGPYREYVTMGGVVGGGLVDVGGDKNKLIGVGQWGNNLYVSTQIAEDVCKQVWGVPAQVADIDFVESGDALSDDFMEGRNKFSLAGWKNARILPSSESSDNINGNSFKRYGNIPIFWTPTIKALWAPISFPSLFSESNANNNGDSAEEPLPVHKLRLSASALKLKRCDRKLPMQSGGEIPLGLALVVDNVLIEIGERVTAGSL